MRFKSIYVVSDNNWTSWELASKEEICLSIINQAVPNKKPKVYHHFFTVDELTVEEAYAVSNAFSCNREFNKHSGVRLDIYHYGEAICDDDGHILHPSSLEDFLKCQYELWRHTLPWPSEDDEDITPEEMEVNEVCLNSNVENAD